MKSIWKFPLRVQGLQDVEMPKGAEILCVQTQNTNLCLWAIVDTEAEREVRMIAVIGTGHEMGADNFKYIGSSQMMESRLMWHVSEVLK